MPVLSRLIFLLLIGLAAAAAQTAAQAADASHRGCLTKAEQRAVVANHEAISLAEAIKTAAQHVRYADVLRAEICRRGEVLVYELTLLARDGKVKHASVDAENGKYINRR